MSAHRDSMRIVKIIMISNNYDAGCEHVEHSLTTVVVLQDNPEEPDSQAEADEEAYSDKKEKSSIFSGVRKGIRKLFGAARDMTTSFINKTLSVLSLDIKIFRKYKKRFDKHTKREQVRWWFEVWGDESALKALDSKWAEVSAENKWRLETCRPLPQSG